MYRFKKIFLVVALLVFSSSCGYTPMFSKKKVNFSIENMEFFGDKFIKEKISNALSSYKNKSDNDKKVSLIILSSKNTTIASKNSKGEAETNRININVNVKIILAENDLFEKNIMRSSIYSTVDRKSEQKLIEEKLIVNLSNEIAQLIIFEIVEKTK